MRDPRIDILAPGSWFLARSFAAIASWSPRRTGRCPGGPMDTRRSPALGTAPRHDTVHVRIVHAAGVTYARLDITCGARKMWRDGRGARRLMCRADALGGRQVSVLIDTDGRWRELWDVSR